MGLLSRLFSRKPVSKTEEEIAALIEGFANGTGGRWDWDYFISTDFENERVKSAQKECFKVEKEFPRTGRVGWCNEQGLDRLRAIASELRAASRQPVPQVTAGDVERVVCRDFSADEYGTVMATLSEYGTEKWHREPVRVRLAALKVANGSVHKLRACVESAKRDYRDALAAAEYPAYHKIGFRVRKLPAEEQSRIINSDWRQYEDWLKR